MKKKLIVISADAMVTEDVAYFKTLPNYKKYLAGGCEIQKVTSIYPTITYPCHTTMATGVWPEKHGVTGNLQFHPGQAPLPWKWEYSNNLWKEDIFTVAKEAGYTTAAVFWPVTGNHPAIDHLITEYWTQGEEDTPREAWKRMGSSEEMLEIVERNIGNNEIRKHPQTEEFIIKCSCDIIRQYKPDVLFLHPANIDAYRHRTGLFNEKVTYGIEETDRWLGKIMSAVEEIGELENTNIVITSDHGHLNINRVMNPNVILADHGLIRKNEDGSLKDWDAWCLSGGLSGLVYLKDPQNQEIYDKTYRLLQDMAEEGIYGISQVFTTQEAKEKYHLSGEFSFVLESDDFSSFGDAINRPIVRNYDITDYRYGRATHGHLPFKGPNPIFLAKGPDFRENVVLENGQLIDEAPTYAKLLGVELKHADGKAVEEFLK